MAAKKRKTTSKKTSARKSKKSTALVTLESIQSTLAEDAAADTSKIILGEGNKISIKGKKFKYRDTDLGNPLNLIIIDSVIERSYYDRKYDADNTCPPACFALADSEHDDLSPSINSPDAQSENCNECPHDEYGTALVGKGKRCRTHIRLLCVDGAYDTYSVDDLDELEYAILSVPATSLNAWKGYVNKLGKHKSMPTYAVVTEVSFDPESDYGKLEFNLVETVQDPNLIMAIREKRNELYDTLRYEYDVSGYTPPDTQKKATKKKTSKKVAKKKTAKKKKFGK